MTTAIVDPSKYDADLIEVGRKITKADPPLWLLVGLTHFSPLICSDKAKYKEEFNRKAAAMSQAITVLLASLPMFQSLGAGVQCPEEVKIALVVLPKIKALLDKLKPPRHRLPDGGRYFCAAVVVEAWRLLHGKVPRRSAERLYEACNHYRCACGAEEIGKTGDRDNWRRAVANTDAGPIVRPVLTVLRSHPELAEVVQNFH